jgi:sugar/nucleoside kinase (ribokinase family)
LARLGIPTRFIGSVGEDGYGHWSAEGLQQEGVDIQFLRFVDRSYTSFVLAAIHPDGERELFVWPDSGGAHTRLSPDMITRDIFDSAGWLHTTGLCLREVPVREAQLLAMRLARESGIPVSLDLNLRLETWGLDKAIRKVFDQAISLADVVFGSGVDEILPYTGKDSIQMGAEELSGSERIVIARLGRDGALVVGPGTAFSSPAFPVAVVDTLGAGDAFNGGFICAQLENQGLQESVRWGNAAAGLKIGQAGARGLPDRTELIGFLKSID